MTIIQGKYESAIRYLDTTAESYFEFMLPFVEPAARFREIDRFLWESRHSLRFKNEYTGNVLVELSGWNDKTSFEFNEYFDAFLFFLKSRKDKLRPVFFVAGTCSPALYEHLSKHYELVILDPEKGEVPLSDSKVTIGFGNRGE